MANVRGVETATVSDRSILVVEDDHELSDLLVGIFHSEGYHPLAAYDAANAMAMAISDRPHVITLDLSMPNRDGRELLHDLKDNAGTSQIPIVVLSAFTDQLDAHDRTLLSGVIQKPFDLSHLLTVISRLIATANR